MYSEQAVNINKYGRIDRLIGDSPKLETVLTKMERAKHAASDLTMITGENGRDIYIFSFITEGSVLGSYLEGGNSAVPSVKLPNTVEDF